MYSPRTSANDKENYAWFDKKFRDNMKGAFFNEKVIIKTCPSHYISLPQALADHHLPVYPYSRCPFILLWNDSELFGIIFASKYASVHESFLNTPNIS
jgi:hypothetical protein